MIQFQTFGKKDPAFSGCAENGRTKKKATVFVQNSAVYW
jgi:hypothetical protein